MKERYRSAFSPEVMALDSKAPDFAPDGCCQWCGKNRESKRKGRFCKAEKRTYDWGPATWRPSKCYFAWAVWWWGRPAYQRVILIRDDFTCQLCGLRPLKDYAGVELPEMTRLHVDHVVAFSKGGDSHPDNLQTLCRTCNLKKGTK